MDKETLKKQVYKALQKSPLKDDLQRVSLFGSYVHGDASEKSDVDLLIEFFPSSTVTLFDLVDMKDFMDTFLNKKVDLVMREGLSPHLKDHIINHAELIYEKR